MTTVVLKIKYLSDGKKTVCLYKPRVLFIKYVDYIKDGDRFTGWEIDEQDAGSGIYVLSRTPGEAYADYEEHFMFLWETYAKEDDDKLTRQAQKLKRRLLFVVEKEIIHECNE